MLYDKLKNYSNSGIYPFHMPGHKRNIIDENLPYDIDLTEIYDFDNLHNAEGCIKDISDKAARLYGVSKAYLLVNGATGGIMSAIRSLTNYGDKIIMARNCHKSVYNAAEICGLNAEYILPDYDSEFGIFSSVNPQKIETMLNNNPDTRLVIITSPTYEGVVSDIKTISDICHKFGAKLFVDEAHGAHFPFHNKFPAEAIKCGADVVVTSLHKTLPSLTQTALLLTNHHSLYDKIEENLSVFESSSPSYILMSSIEKCLDYITDNKTAFDDYINRLNKFYKACSQLKYIKVLCSENDKSTHSFYDFDKSKIIISVKNTSITGAELADMLRTKFNIEIEMAYSDYVIAITSVCDTNKGFDMLINALLEIDKSICKTDNQSVINYSTELPQKVFIPADKYSKIGITIPLDNAENKVSLEYIWAYPPGVPIITPGERIDKNIINQINQLKDSEVEIYSTYKNAPKNIKVAETD